MEKSKNRILREGAVIAVGTLITRALGFIREILAAFYFGSGAVYDAFVVAFAVPNLFRGIAGEEMFERAFLPPFKRMRGEGRSETARRFLFSILVISTVVVLLFTLLAFLFAPSLVHFLAPGMKGETFLQALRLSKVLLPFLLLISLASLAGALLLFSGRSLLYGLAPGVANGALILYVFLFQRSQGILSMAVAELLGALASLLFMVPAVMKILRELKREGGGGREPSRAVTRSFREGGHIFCSSLINKGVEVVDRVVASLIGTGAISSLWYSFRITQLPLAILSLSLTRGIAPQLSQMKGEKNRKGFRELVQYGFDLNLFSMVPTTIFFLVFAPDIVALFYRRGAFGQRDVQETALAFFFYAFALLPLGIVTFLGRVYSALEDNKLPLMAALVGGGVNVACKVLLYKTPLRQGGNALATAIGFFLSASILLIALKRYRMPLNGRNVLRSLGRLTVALSLFLPVLLLGRLLISPKAPFLTLALRLGVTAFAAFGLYGLLVYGFLRDRSPGPRRVVLTGGGTGGHVYPSLALWTLLKERGLAQEALFLGIPGRAEEAIVPRSGVPLKFIRSAPLASGSPLQKIGSLFVILQGTLLSLVHIWRFKPHMVVATGGYVSAPVIFAAALLRPVLKLKIIVEEQNLVPGLLNNLASLVADLLLVNFKETAYFLWSNRCVYAGYPVRPEYGRGESRREARAKLGIPEEAFLVLVSGGSLGARTINRRVASSLPSLSGYGNLRIVHSTGLKEDEYYSAFSDTLAQIPPSPLYRRGREEGSLERVDGEPFYQAKPYLHDIIDYQRAADLVISRAGAGSLAEITALGRAAILVPKRGLPGNHQELNAIAVGEQDGAEVLFERRDPLTGEEYLEEGEFLRLVDLLYGDGERRKRLEEGAGRLFYRQASETIASVVGRVLEERSVSTIEESVEPNFVKFQRQFDSLILYLDRTFASKGKENLYCRFYNIQVEEALRSDRFERLNNGIKLAGALRREDLFPVLYENYSRYSGFLRRNTLIALGKSEHYHPEFLKYVKLGMGDNYYEVRREAVSLFRRFHVELSQDQEIRNRVLRLLGQRWESFEVKQEALKAAALFLSQEEYLRLTRPFLASRNIRLREALLESLDRAVRDGRFLDKEPLSLFLKDMLITTSEFKPEFRVRERYLRVVQHLEERATHG